MGSMCSNVEEAPPQTNAEQDWAQEDSDEDVPMRMPSIPIVARPPDFQPLHVRGLRLAAGRKAQVDLAEQQDKLLYLEAAKDGGVDLEEAKDPEQLEIDIEKARYLAKMMEKRVERFKELGPKCEELCAQVFAVAAEGDADYLRFSLDARVHPDMQDASGMTTLMHATITNKLTVVQTLLEHRADPGVQDVNGATASHYAVQLCHIHVLKELVTPESGLGALAIRDARKFTPIDYARIAERTECMRLLVHRLGGRHRVAVMAYCTPHPDDPGCCPCSRVRKKGSNSQIQADSNAGDAEV